MPKGTKNFTFNNAPAIQMSRSRITGLSYGVLTSTSLGRLFPFYNEEILPGDTIKCRSSIVSRLTSAFIKPIYGNLYLDTFYFFIPWRLVFDKFPNVFGENTESAWANQTVYECPHQFQQTVVSKSIADYLEIPLGLSSAPINTMYLRAFALIYDQWFRDENFQAPMHIQKGVWNAVEALNGDAFSPSNYTGLCPQINKYRDYFTSAVPAPQKGSAVEISPASFSPLVVNPSSGNPVSSLGGIAKFGASGIGDLDSFGGFPINVSNASTNLTTPNLEGGQAYLFGDNRVPFGGDVYPIDSSNLGINLASGVTVNDLRLAFQTQKILERDVLGTRYVEHIFTTFGVSNPDARLQRAELLGARSIKIDIQQVANTGSNNNAQSGDSSEPLASLAAYSLSSGRTGFSKAFTEYGVVIGVAAMRQFHQYQQGLPKRFNRYKRLDYYNPALAYIGMMPVMSTEIWSQASLTDVFGYQRPWAEYRHHQNAVTAEMRSDVDNSLDIWHLADDYSSQPVASGEFVQETPQFLNRTIVIDSSVQDQFILDIWHDVDAVRVMPANPMPGLIDHY